VLLVLLIGFLLGNFLREIFATRWCGQSAQDKRSVSKLAVRRTFEARRA